jgi:hypothetical protein
MKLVRLFIPGEFEDAFVYMGRLLALTTEGSLKFYHLEPIVDSLESELPGVRSLLRILFLRNEWLNEQFSTMRQNEPIQKAINSSLDVVSTTLQPSDHVIESSLEDERDIGSVSLPILDIDVYYQRLYMASVGGLYHLDLDWSPNSDFMSSRPMKRHDARSMSCTSGFGTVNVSCGDDGLFSAFQEFGTISRPTNGHFRQTADRSVRTSWLSRDLMNYRTMSEPVLLESQQERSTPRGNEREKWLVTSIGERTVGLESVLRRALYESGEADSEASFVFNSRNTLFLYTGGRRLVTVGMKPLRGDGLNVSYVRKQESIDDDVLDMRFCNAGTVIETGEAVKLFNEGTWYELYKGAILTVRTFPRAVHYRNLIVVTTEAGITILSPATFANEMLRQRS